MIFNHNTTNEKTLILLESSSTLINETELLLLKLINCDNHPCLKNKKQIDSLHKQLNSFLNTASIDKNLVSLVGATEYSKLTLIINKFIATGTEQKIIKELTPILIEMKNSHLNIIKNQNKKNSNNQLRDNIITALLVIILTILLIVAVYIIESKKNKQNKQINNKEQGIEKLLSVIGDLNSNYAKSILNDLNLSKEERTIYSKLKKLNDKIEESERNTDLSRQLYSMIGYEMRGISNTIKGGIHLLIKEKEEDEKLTNLARDLEIATETLSNLAENYNKLFSQGLKQKTENYSFIKLLTEIIVHISNKGNESELNIECIIHNNLPNELMGNPTKLFWILFLQLSNAISAQNKDNILIDINSHSSDDVSGSVIVITLIFLTTLDISENKINHLHWEQSKRGTVKNDEWTISLLDNINTFNTEWYKSGQQQKFSIKMGVTPISYTKESPLLKNKFFLICADSEIRISIISKLLISHGAKVKVSREANEIFKSISKISLYDAIIMTDTVKGIQLTSFCKTLHERIPDDGHTKLLLAVSSNQVVKSAIQYVNQVFYTPLIPDDFIPQLVKAVEDEESNDEIKHQFLIVEDDRIQQFILKKILQQAEYETDIVNGGLEAVNWVKNNTTDIIFMDCIMPGMGGLQATELIRQYEKENNIQPISTIIGATALTSKSEHQACLEAGMNYVISKPYNSDEILKSIKRYIHIHNKRGS